jgi:glycerol-3-phosphate dehydrogenase
MAQDTVDKVIEVANLPRRACVTRNLSIHGNKTTANFNDHLYVYGFDREKLLALISENPCWGEKLHPKMDYLKVEVIWAVRHEMARTVEDVLARRVRALFLDARAAIDMAPVVAGLLAKELNKDQSWEDIQVADFTYLAEGYLLIGL